MEHNLFISYVTVPVGVFLVDGGSAGCGKLETQTLSTMWHHHPIQPLAICKQLGQEEREFGGSPEPEHMDELAGTQSQVYTSMQGKLGSKL